MRNTQVYRSGKLGWLPMGLATLALLLTVGCQSAAPAKPATTAAATTAPAATAAATTAPAATSAATTAPPTPGQQVFTSNCNACHPGGRQGAGPTLVGVTGRLSDAQITQKIRQGAGEMPAMGGTISEPQMADLLAYLKTLR